MLFCTIVSVQILLSKFQSSILNIILKIIYIFIQCRNNSLNITFKFKHAIFPIYFFLKSKSAFINMSKCIKFQIEL